jgi:Flp pilus assembly protein TadG
MGMVGSSVLEKDESGAAIVEMALVVTLLLVVLFGIIEFSWAFAQQNDVRHGAREGARAAAVDTGDTANIGQLVCDRMDIVNPADGVTVVLTPVSADGATGGLATIRVEANIQTLTGFFDTILSHKVSSEVEFRTEQPASGEPYWWNDGAASSYTCP